MTYDPVDVLLVEDNPSDAELSIRALREKGLRNSVAVARDGAEALDFMFCRNQYASRKGTSLPHLILLDLRLPRVDGIEVLRQIKADPKTAGVPVVVLTSSGQDPDIETCYALGANSYIVKPVDFEKFATAMGEVGYYWLLLNQPPR